MTSRGFFKFLYLMASLRRQWYRPERIKTLQNKLLQSIIYNAYFNTEFYRRLYAKLLSGKGMEYSVCLKKLPVISKQQVREAFENKTIIKKKYKGKFILRKTSGSSGFPLTVIYSPKDYAYCEAIYARALLSQGVRPTDKIAYFWYECFKERGFWENLGFFRKNEILYTENENRQLDSLVKLNPTVIHAFPSILTVLAKRFPDIACKIRPRIIITHGELLTAEARKAIEAVFYSKVLDQYGTNEFVRMAWECPECRNYHVDDDSIIIEILDSNNNEVEDNQRGRIVVTSLVNSLMPLIRYDIGDYAVKSSSACSCGRGLSLIRSIEGRADDFIVRENNVLVSPRKIGGILESVKFIRQYRFIQLGMNEFVLYIVPGFEFSDKDKKEIELLIYSALGNDINFHIKLVEYIQRGLTGKIKAVESKMAGV